MVFYPIKFTSSNFKILFMNLILKYAAIFLLSGILFLYLVKKMYPAKVVQITLNHPLQMREAIR